MKNKKIKVLIFGAGAIGRGFLAPLLYSKNFSITFVEVNKNLINLLKKNNYYYSAFTKKNNYDLKKIYFDGVFHIDEKFDLKNYDILFSCVGPKQCLKIISKFKDAKKIFICENDIKLKEIIQKKLKTKQVYFCIPDVITSNTAPSSLMKKDKLCTVSEKGILVMEKNPINFNGIFKKVNSKFLIKHWNCKLFIHNAPHAIVAYLGKIKKHKYIHQAMNDKIIKDIVTKSLKEITEGLIFSKLVDKKFANFYKKKELNRFKNKLLFDPISRVGREPLRKLSFNNRLIQAIKIASYNGKTPFYTIVGLKAALRYFDKEDDESLKLRNLINLNSEQIVLKKFSYK